MKKLILIIALFTGFVGTTFSQKYALVDMEYILNNLSVYNTANEQLEIISKMWQSEIDNEQQEVQTMYKSYQTNLARLSAEQKTKLENEIVEKEKNIQELKRKYYGPEGELFKKREALIVPIQDNIYKIIKEISDEKKYLLIIDKSSSNSIIFASPSIDISEQVLSRLGYSK